MPAGVTGRGQRAGLQKQDFSHAGTASTVSPHAADRRNRMNPGVHRAVARWKPRFTSFSAGLTFTINSELSDIGP